MEESEVARKRGKKSLLIEKKRAVRSPVPFSSSPSLSPFQMTSSSSSADDYARACLRVACAQLAEAAGFASARRTALDVLSDAAARYAASLGRAAKGYAEAAGRGTGNISDVVSEGV